MGKISPELRLKLQVWLERKPNSTLCEWVITGQRAYSPLIEEMQVLWKTEGLDMLTPFNVSLHELRHEDRNKALGKNERRIAWVKKTLEVQDDQP